MPKRNKEFEQLIKELSDEAKISDKPKKRLKRSKNTDNDSNVDNDSDYNDNDSDNDNDNNDNNDSNADSDNDDNNNDSDSDEQSHSGEYTLEDYERIRHRKVQKWTKFSKDKNFINKANDLFIKLFPRFEVVQVLQMNIPDIEKEKLIMEVDDLLHTEPGTRSYHEDARYIAQKIAQYSEEPRILPIVRRVSQPPCTPTLRAIADSKADDAEKKEMMFMLDDIHATPAHNPYHSEMVKKLTERIEIANAKDPLLESIITQDPVDLVRQIWNSDISLYNKKVLISKAQELLKLSSDDAAKLRQYIMDGMKLSDKIIPLVPTDNIQKYLHSVKDYMDRELYGQHTVKNHLLELIALRLKNPNAKEMSLGLCGPPGIGKCLHPDTLVLLYLGGMKKASELRRNDILMGDDSQPRVVTGTSSGRDSMYVIEPKYTEKFSVNLPHILTLHDDLSNKTIDIPLEQYMMRSEQFKQRFKLFTVPLEYDTRQVKNDPYMIGILLGSNKKNVNDVIKEYLEQRLNNVESYIAGKLDCQTIRADTFDTDELAFVMNHRHIPEQYLFNNRKIRHKLLLGFLAAQKTRKDTRNSIDAFNENLGLPNNRSRSVERFGLPKKPTAKIYKVVVPKDTIRRTKRSVTPSAYSRSSLKEFMEEKYGAGNISYSPIRDKEPELDEILSAENSYRSKAKAPSSVQRIMRAVESARQSLVETNTVIRKDTPPRPKPKHSQRLSLQDIVAGLTAEDLDDFEKLEEQLNAKPASAQLNKTTIQKAPEPTVPKAPERKSRLAQFRTKIPKLPSTTVKITNPVLGEQLKFLARSLGYKSTYADSELIILDDVTKLPSMDRKIVTEFSVRATGNGNYCGITITGNGRFVLASGVVTHNTEIARIFAGSINQPFAKINMGGVTDPSYFLGHSYTYIGSKPGAITKALMQLKAKTGIIFLDEFDKIKPDSNIAHLMLHVTDPVQQSEFSDHYFEELKIDLSHITYIFSFNDQKHVNPILLGRIPVIEMKSYNIDDYKNIMTKFILPKILSNVSLNTSDIILSPDIQTELAKFAIEMNQGARSLKHILQRIVLKVNLKQMLEGSFKYPLIITQQILQQLHIDIEKKEYLSMYV